MRAESPYPPLTVSLGRALLATAGSLPILLVAFVYVGVVWLGLVGVGMELFPRTLVAALALPPASSFFVDWIIPGTVFGISGQGTLVIVAMTLLRAVVWSILVGMTLEAIEYGSASTVGVLEGLRALPSILMIVALNILAVIMGIFVLPTILGGIGFLVFTAVLAGGLYLLPFSSPAAVRGPLPAREAMRRSVRAARLPGPRHLSAVILYFFVVLMLVFLVPGGSIVTANPPLVEWVWILGGTVVQLVFLAMFCERWVGVEDQVPTGPAPRARARGR
jgi:hypothetical protein